VRAPDRPDLVAGVPTLLRDGAQWINPAAFTTPQVGTFGNLKRGSLTGPGLTEIDISLSKNTRINDRFTLQFRTEAFNVINHTNFGVPNLVLSSAAFGQFDRTATFSRQIQFGVKLIM